MPRVSYMSPAAEKETEGVRAWEGRLDASRRESGAGQAAEAPQASQEGAERAAVTVSLGSNVARMAAGGTLLRHPAACAALRGSLGDESIPAGRERSGAQSLAGATEAIGESQGSRVRQTPALPPPVRSPYSLCRHFCVVWIGCHCWNHKAADRLLQDVPTRRLVRHSSARLPPSHAGCSAHLCGCGPQHGAGPGTDALRTHRAAQPGEIPGDLWCATALRSCSCGTVRVTNDDSEHTKLAHGAVEHSSILTPQFCPSHPVDAGCLRADTDGDGQVSRQEYAAQPRSIEATMAFAEHVARSHSVQPNH